MLNFKEMKRRKVNDTSVGWTSGMSGNARSGLGLWMFHDAFTPTDMASRKMVLQQLRHAVE